MDFQCGDQVVYGSHGVCRVTGVETRRVDRKQVDYYVLRPCTQAETAYYVPVNNAAAVAKMRRMLTRQELEALLSSEQVRAECWIEEENLRKEHYRRLISRADCAELIPMIRALNRQKQRQIEAGKKFHVCDENFLKDAQRLITGEVSQIMGIAPAEVGDYIRRQMGK